MIDFRYHIVSIVAVFLALAIGIVLGTTALNGAVLDNLKQNVDGLSSDKRSLESQVRAGQAQLSDEQAFERAVAPRLVDGRLAGVRIVLVSAPGAAPSLRDGLAAMFVLAGATVTTQLSVSSEFLDPGSDAALDAVAAHIAPAAVRLAGTSVQHAGTALAAVLLARSGSAARTAALQAALAELSNAGYVSVTGGTSTPGAVAVLIAGAAPTNPDQTSAVATQRLLVLAGALRDAGSGVLIAGPITAAARGGLIAALRADNTLAASISSVDDADTVAGQVGAVLALVEQVHGGVGQYGRTDNAGAPVPSPTATTTPR